MDKQKLDIFEVLGQLNNKNTTYYQQLEPEIQKQIQPLVVNRWMTGTSDDAQVYIDNEVVNPYIFSLSHHKNLLWKLMCAANSGRSQRYQWIKHSSQGTTSLAVQAIQQYFNYNSSDATQALTVLTKKEVIQIADDLGWQSDQIAALDKQLKAKE